MYFLESANKYTIYNNNYYPNGTECHSFESQHCSKRDSKKRICSSCLPGYYLEEGKCHLCNNSIGNCKLCSRKETCIECHEGYLWRNGQCVDCIKNKEKCTKCSTTSDICLICFDQSYPNEEKTCESYYTRNYNKCDISLWYWESHDNCLNKLFNYKQEQGTCTVCKAENCLDCVDDKYKCYKCVNWFYFDNELYKVSYWNHPMKQKKNKSSLNKIKECLECTTGYFTVRTQCKPCGDNRCGEYDKCQENVSIVCKLIVWMIIIHVNHVIQQMKWIIKSINVRWLIKRNVNNVNENIL